MSIRHSQLKIIKVSATGNDFLLVDLLDRENSQAWTTDWLGPSRSELAQKWCDRHEGLGADGLMILEADDDAQVDFKWDFFNSDGGGAELCGNASRAVALYMQRTRGQSHWCFRTRAGLVEAQVDSADRIEVELPAIASEKWNQKISSPTPLLLDWIVAGVPHAVLKVNGLEDRQRLRETALAVKSDPRFQPDGTNVTFVANSSAKTLQSMTFERGVEDFTLACGTGAVSAAHSILKGKENTEIQVQVPGGLLSVIWKKGKPHLIGPAKIVAEMHVVLP